MDCILPFAMITAWSSFCAAPVPSITRTWFNTITGASTLTKSTTSTAFGVCAAATVETNKVAIRNMQRILTPRRFCCLESVKRRNYTPEFLERKLQDLWTGVWPIGPRQLCCHAKKQGRDAVGLAGGPGNIFHGGSP